MWRIGVFFITAAIMAANVIYDLGLGFVPKFGSFIISTYLIYLAISLAGLVTMTVIVYHNEAFCRDLRKALKGRKGTKQETIALVGIAQLTSALMLMAANQDTIAIIYMLIFLFGKYFAYLIKKKVAFYAADL